MGYRELAGRLQSIRAEAIYFAGFPAELEIIKSNLKASGANIAVIASDAAASTFPLQEVQSHQLADGEHIYMARHLSFAASSGELTLTSFEAFKKSAQNLATFISVLGVDANGDQQGATFVSACIPNECR
jgi:hypothetical protein